jgi:hypothetical protein
MFINLTGSIAGNVIDISAQAIEIIDAFVRWPGNADGNQAGIFLFPRIRFS